MKKTKRTKTVKNATLAKKLTFIMGCLITVIFFLMNLFSLARSSKSLNASISREFTGIADENSAAIQAIMQDADRFYGNISSYLYNTHNKDKNLSPIPSIRKKTSAIYGTPINEAGYVSEAYLLNTAWGAVESSEHISGVGVYFEPYKFNPAYSDYGFYVSESDLSGHTNGKREYATYSAKNYFIEAKKTLKPHFTAPYVDSHGVSMVSACYPLIQSGEFFGIVLADIPITSFAKAAVVKDNFKTLAINIYDNENLLVYDSTGTGKTGDNLSDLLPENIYQKTIDGFAKGVPFKMNAINQAGEKVTQFYVPITLGSEVWWANSSLLTSDLNKDNKSMMTAMLIIAALSLIFILLFMAAAIKKMLDPIHEIVQTAERIEAGDLEVELTVSSQDEIGVLSLAFNNMARNMKSIIEDLSYILGEMANGNFLVRSNHEEKYIGAYHKLLDAIRNINTHLSRTLTQIDQAAKQVDAGADQVSSGAQALSQGSTEQAASVQELSATIAETSSGVNANAKKADEANIISRDAERQVEQGNKKMQEMIEAMQDISDKSNEIGKIIKTIDDIAFQTNILALNAAVEAARAGVAGKGFAVVADEVRNLAQKSAEAAKSTTVLIEGATAAVSTGVNIANETAAHLTEIAEKTGESTRMIREISEISKEQAAGVEQILLGIDQISSVVQTNSATSEQSAAASEQLSAQAAELRKLVEQFKLIGKE